MLFMPLRMEGVCGSMCSVCRASLGLSGIGDALLHSRRASPINVTMLLLHPFAVK